MTVTEEPPYESESDEPDSFALLRRVIEIVENAKPLPLSSSVRIEPGEVLDLLDDAVAKMPDEIKRARYMLRERKEFLGKVYSEGDLILDEARAQATRMVDRQEIVRQARIKAQEIVQSAEDDARRRRFEAEDWCDRHLAKFEINIGKISVQVTDARNQLRSLPAPEVAPTEAQLKADEAANAFFDQDTT